jgi:uncharacterized protein YegJ (DUF2314 family)
LRHYSKLYELGILTDVPEPTKVPIFWKECSIQQYRDKIADWLYANGDKQRAEEVRKPQVWLEVRILAASLHIPQRYVIFKFDIGDEDRNISERIWDNANQLALDQQNTTKVKRYSDGRSRKRTL